MDLGNNGHPKIKSIWNLTPRFFIGILDFMLSFHPLDVQNIKKFANVVFNQIDRFIPGK